MKLTMTSEIRAEAAKKLNEIFKDFGYTGTRTNIPDKLLGSTDYRKALKDFFKELLSNNVSSNPQGDISVIFDTFPDEGEKSFDQLAELGKDFLIGIDLKRKPKNRLYPDVTQVPMEDINTYRDDLKRIMIANEMVKPKMSDKKWLKVWVKQLNKWDKKGITDFAKASTQKSGLGGMMEKSKNKKAVSKKNPSPINLRGLNDVLNTLTEGKNIMELTPQVYKVLSVVKTTNVAPKVNQEETLKEESTDVTVDQD